MANPIPFKPIAADPAVELQRRLAAAPKQHAEAMLVAWDLLQAAHDQGLLDLAHGMVSAKDAVTRKLAEYAKLPEGISGIRNLIGIGRVMMAIDPEIVDGIARGVAAAGLEQSREEKPPSLWQLSKRVLGEDGRRGLSFMTLVLASLGKTSKS